MKKIFAFYPTIIAIAALLPIAASAALPVGTTQIENILSNIGGTLNVIIAFLFVLATIIFLWGVIQYVTKGSDAKAQQEARNLMLWGIIGLAVMVSVWGIVNIVLQYFVSGDIGFIPKKPGEVNN